MNWYKKAENDYFSGILYEGWMLPNGNTVSLPSAGHVEYIIKYPEQFNLKNNDIKEISQYKIYNQYKKYNEESRIYSLAFINGGLRLIVIRRIPPILVVEGLEENISKKTDKLIDFAIENKINSIESHYVGFDGQLTGKQKITNLSEEYAYAKNNNRYKMAQQEKIMYLLRSPSGAGKSMLAKQLAGNNGVALESDEFFMQQGKYVFDIDKQIEAHNWNQDRCLEAMENGISPIVIANTNTQAIEAEPYVRMAIGHGYKIRIEEPSWHKELKDPITEKWNFDFLKGRNMHNVPEDVLKKMIDRYENKDEFIKKLKELIARK